MPRGRQPQDKKVSKLAPMRIQPQDKDAVTLNVVVKDSKYKVCTLRLP